MQQEKPKVAITTRAGYGAGAASASANRTASPPRQFFLLERSCFIAGAEIVIDGGMLKMIFAE
jgi:hypothetical protein